MNKIIYLNLVLSYYMNSCSLAIDSHDFLNSNYLPYTLMLETSLLDNDNSSTTNDNTTAIGDMSNALNTMRYHRSMINEYLCHNFVAKEILEEFGLQGYGAEDRSGIAAEKINKKTPPVDNNELLDDVGLDSYKKWLAKSAILNDIYKHYDVEENDGSSQIYASGEVTGYAIQTDGTTKKLNNEETESKNNRGLYKLSHHQSSGLIDSAASNPEIDVYNPHYDFDTSQHGYTFSGHSSTGSGYGGTDHYHHTPSHQTHHTVPTHHHVEEEKGLALKDLFDLALTALAFLGFGLFVINIIMTCFAAQQGTTVVMQMPTDGGTGTPGSDGTIRVKRDTGNIKINELNRLSYHVLSSIDSLIMLQHDKEQEHCLKRSLCESNKFSRFLPLNQQIWVPIWSFGVSWISGKLLHQELRIENLRAILLGLGKANCKTLYRKCKILNETIKK